ncbi:hypothetical protein CsSME_00028538 [Camellia sinensis var. sinensis]
MPSTFSETIAFLWSHIMPPLTEGVARIIEIVDAPTASDALAGAAPPARGLTSPADNATFPLEYPSLSTAYPEMGCMDQCLELIDTLMVIVQRREASLVSLGIEVAAPPAMRERGGRAPSQRRGG